MIKIDLLDCTLRDGAYINGSEFGTQTIGGVIKRLQDANVDIIECGWLKDSPHKEGNSYYHVPTDLEQYLLSPKRKDTTYVAMIDYNRYNIDSLPINNGKNIDAIRVVFPRGKVDEAMLLVQPIRDKGYKVFFQAANTLSYSNEELKQLAEKVNEISPVGLSIVDTFGAMWPADLMRIVDVLDQELDPQIMLGFHSHNNQQLSFALSILFAQEMIQRNHRDAILDSSLCGMGRGAGNTCTELLTNYLNKTYHTDYDLNIIMDTIDVYMNQFIQKYSWGYSIPYYIAGMYETHVNNVAYLQDTHAVKNKDMKIIFSSMDAETRRKYDYDNLEKVYNLYVNRKVDDQEAIDVLKQQCNNRTIVTILPGKSSVENQATIIDFIDKGNALTIGVNAALSEYKYDFLFFTSEKKYEYAKENNEANFEKAIKILTSNIKAEPGENEIIINYNDLQKYGWKYYDNSMLMLLRLLKKLDPQCVAISGFDGFKNDYANEYAPTAIKGNLSQLETAQLQSDIESMLKDYMSSFDNKFEVKFLTPSPFAKYF